MNIVLFSDLKDKFSDTASLNNGSIEDTYVFYKYDERYIHIKKILKLSIGSIFKVAKINGKIGSAKIILFSDEKLVFAFEEKSDPVPLPSIKIILGFPRPIQLKRILRDIASLGFSDLYLVGTDLGEASYLKSNLANNEQIEKYLLDGIIQSGQSLVPNFCFFNSVKECVTNLKDRAFFKHSKKILLDVETSHNDINSLADIQLEDDELIFAVGSERGWTENERAIFKAYQFKPYSMGERILRTETAVVAGLSVLLSKAGAR